VSVINLDMTFIELFDFGQHNLNSIQI
jgi:hypothetical protein